MQTHLFFTEQEEGQSLVEYGLTLASVALAVILVLAFFGETLQLEYCSITHQISPDGDISSACDTPIIIPVLRGRGADFINLEATIYDPDGDQSNPYALIDRVEFYLDSTSNLVQTEFQYRYCLGGGDASCNNFNIGGLSPGKHKIYIRAYDDDGNVGRETYSFSK
jgi:Flp pilus assembly pilin Flp